MAFKLFKPRYTKYYYTKDVVVRKEIMANRYEELMANDPDEINSVPTGKFKDVTYEVWTRTHLKTGLPQHKHILKVG